MPFRRSSSKSSPKTQPNSNRITKPKPHLAIKTKRSPEFHEKLSNMRLSIAPIVHVETGVAPPDFPRNMLALFLLTEEQLDRMARYYNQSTTPTALTFAYPEVMQWDRAFLSDDPDLPDNCKLTALERLAVKMRVFAKFIGMRGAEIPEWECERQIEILGNRVGVEVRREEEAAWLRKSYRGSYMRP